MRSLILLPLCTLIACGGEAPDTPGTGPTGTTTGQATSTTPGGPTGTSTGTTTPVEDSCTATVSVDEDDDGTVDRIRLERWAPFPEQQTSRVEHFTDASSAVIRRDWWDWDANGNNTEYARDDYNDGVVDHFNQLG